MSKLIKKDGFTQFEGSKEIKIGNYANVFAHDALKNIMVYINQEKSPKFNVISESDEEHQEALAAMLEKLRSEAEEEFLKSVPHSVRVGDVFFAHENINTEDRSKTDPVHFYQVTTLLDSGFVELMEIESKKIQFKNHSKAIPLIGAEMQYTQKFSCTIIDNTILTPTGLIGIKADFDVLHICDGVVVKIYKPVSFGLIISSKK